MKTFHFRYLFSAEGHTGWAMGYNALSHIVGSRQVEIKENNCQHLSRLDNFYEDCIEKTVEDPFYWNVKGIKLNPLCMLQ